jgi:hypothetical protein
MGTLLEKVLYFFIALEIEISRKVILLYTTSVHKYMAPLIFFENFDHSSYSKYLFKNIKF